MRGNWAPQWPLPSLAITLSNLPDLSIYHILLPHQCNGANTIFAYGLLGGLKKIYTSVKCNHTGHIPGN